MKNEPREIIVHHTADSNAGLQFKKVNEYHRTQEFPQSSLGYFCGYHYFIERNGEYRQARADSDEGAHTKGRNFGSIGIGLAGNFSYEYPTKQQEVTLGNLCKELMKKYNVRITDVVPHRKYANKDCPGSQLKNNWAQIVVLQTELNYLKKLLLWLQTKLG